jgi:hypothetical protein
MILFPKRNLPKKKYVHIQSTFVIFDAEFMDFIETKDYRNKTREYVRFKTIYLPGSTIFNDNKIARETILTYPKPKYRTILRSCAKFISAKKYEKAREGDVKMLIDYWKDLYKVLHDYNDYYKVLNVTGDTLETLKMELQSYETGEIRTIRPTDHDNGIENLESCKSGNETESWLRKFERKELVKNYESGKIPEKEFISKIKELDE